MLSSLCKAFLASITSTLGSGICLYVRAPQEQGAHESTRFQWMMPCPGSTPYRRLVICPDTPIKVGQSKA